MTQQIIINNPLEKLQKMMERISRRQAEIYDDISSFIQAFRRAITASELMQGNYLRGKDNTGAFTRFCSAFDEMKGLSKHYIEEPLELEATTFSRFVYRLIEILSGLRLKYQLSSISDENSFLRLLKEIQAYLRECEKKKSMLSLINCTQIILLKFANRILLNQVTSQKNIEEREILNNMGKKLREELGRLKENEKVGNSKGFMMIGQERQKSDIDDMLLQKREKFITANKTFNDIQQRFDNFKTLDLDFSYFRGSYFQAKGNYDAFYQNYLQRNKFVVNAITQFVTLFQNFILRKQSKTNRKAKNIKNQYDQICLDEKGVNNMYDQDIKDVKGYTLFLPFNVLQSKDSSKISNVYINLGKSQTKPTKIDPSSIFINKSQESYIKGQKHKPNRIDIFFMNRGQTSKKNRIKTDPIKKQKSYTSNFTTNQINQSNDDRTIRFMTPKVSIRTKYFELTSIPIASKQQPKSKAHSNNKFSIRLSDRNNAINWNSKR